MIIKFMKLKKHKNIYHFIYPNQYELCSSMLRLEEFYESPFKEIRGKYFTFDFYADLYAKRNNNVFSYYTDWNGFNIPGNAVLDFYDTFKYELRPKEVKLLGYLTEHLSKYDSNFYVIATHKDDDVEHELAHAMYYLNSEYKKNCDEIYKTVPNEFRKKINKKLKDYGYSSTVYIDETQAYFATDKTPPAYKRFGLTKSNTDAIIKAYKQNFKKFK